MKNIELQALWQRRDRLHIMAEIMEAAKEGQLKTKIMYTVNLSFSQVNEYLTFLTQRGFIDVRPVKGKKVYETTSKGKLYIENYMEMSDRLNTEESVEPQVILN
ncbi:MAG: winged helix-turn-helix domain-containing protein [Candidatus Bathyarchaeota archaeon]|nr:winged helix-turn-helix domain-containing protein [Candidatus Bathyarchaeota archaeon]